MKDFNAAFFGLYENVFLIYLEQHGKQKALDFMRKLFSKALGQAYTAAGFTKGNINDFAKIVKERDEGVGLPVEFPLITPNKIIYQFHRDPFPNLKGSVSANELDDTYLYFKVNFLLGDKWNYITTQHVWDGHPYTEHILYLK